MTPRSIAAGTKARYKAFLNNVDLYAIGLESISAQLKRQEYFDAFSETGAQVIHQISTTFVVSDFSEDHFDVTGKVNFLMRKDNIDEALLEVHVSYSAHFHPKEGSFDRRDAEKFAESEVRLLFWPYFRQALNDVTGRMYIRPVTIPFAFTP